MNVIQDKNYETLKYWSSNQTYWRSLVKANKHGNPWADYGIYIWSFAPIRTAVLLLYLAALNACKHDANYDATLLKNYLSMWVWRIVTWRFSSELCNFIRG